LKIQAEAIKPCFVINRASEIESSSVCCGFLAGVSTISTGIFCGKQWSHKNGTNDSAGVTKDNSYSTGALRFD